MIITKDIKTYIKCKDKKGKPVPTQMVECKCEICGSIFNRMYRNAIIDTICIKCKKSKRAIDYNKAQKGKTFEERYGKEKAEQVKNKIAASLKEGYKIGKYKNYISQSFIERGRACKGKTIEELYGKEKAEEIKKKISKRSSGSNNPMFGKPSPQGSGNGWSGWYKGFFFRSLLELSFLVKSNISEIENAEYIKIKYIDENGKERNYLPDYLKNKKSLIEIKPKKLSNSVRNKLKFQAAKKYAENNNLDFLILTEENVGRLKQKEIKILHDSGEIKFTDRYEQKYQECVSKE